MSISSDSFVVDVCRQPGSESVSGYPKHANDEPRAHAIAEEAAHELESSGNPGEYLVTVCVDKEPVATQMVLVGESLQETESDLANGT